MGDVMSIALRHGLQLPGELVTMLRGIAISEGTGTTLYPGFELIEFAVPYIKRFWGEERSPMTMLPRIAQSALDGVEFTLDLPRRANRLLNQIERGQFEVNINQKIIDDLTGKLQKMTNRMAISMILSAKMMLDWLGEKKAAKALEASIVEVLMEGKTLTPDLKGDAKTADIATAVKKRLGDKSY
jgi:predicted unusual protein kinase regulating ubiquinone biosynthesis (AarF/ABC1/UbiB family)